MISNIKPDRKLLTKQFMILGTISVVFLLIALLFQILVPLDPKVTYSDASEVIWPIAFVVILLIWVLSVPLNILWINNLDYSIESERITIRKGILSKIQQNIPFRAVTDFQLHRSLYDRFLGIGSIRIQTAGQSQTPTGYEANMAGLINYEKLLNMLRIELQKVHTNPESKTDSSENSVIEELLAEVKEIRKIIEKDRKWDFCY